MPLHPGCQRLLMRVQTRKSRQQRRMNINKPPIESLYESDGQHTHETCQQYIVGLIRIDDLRQSLIELVA